MIGYFDTKVTNFFSDGMEKCLFNEKKSFNAKVFVFR